VRVCVCVRAQRRVSVDWLLKNATILISFSLFYHIHTSHHRRQAQHSIVVCMLDLTSSWLDGCLAGPRAYIIEETRGYNLIYIEGDDLRGER